MSINSDKGKSGAHFPFPSLSGKHTTCKDHNNDIMLEPSGHI